SIREGGRVGPAKAGVVCMRFASLAAEAKIMGILTTDMKRLVSEQQLGFIATVCPDGTLNLSPRGLLRSGATIILFLPTSVRPIPSPTCDEIRHWKSTSWILCCARGITSKASQLSSAKSHSLTR